MILELTLGVPQRIGAAFSGLEALVVALHEGHRRRVLHLPQRHQGEAARAKIAAMLGGQWLAAATGVGGNGAEGLNGWGI
jgi:hypothetical protein